MVCLIIHVTSTAPILSSKPSSVMECPTGRSALRTLLKTLCGSSRLYVVLYKLMKMFVPIAERCLYSPSHDHNTIGAVS